MESLPETKSIDSPEPPKKYDVRKVILLLLCMLLAAGVLIFFWQYRKKERAVQAPDTNAQTAPRLSGQAEVPAGQWPALINRTMILDEQAVILDRQDFDYPDRGFKQSSVRFQTSKSIAEIHALYSGYLEQNGWDIRDEASLVSDGLLNLVAGNSKGGQCSVSASVNSITNQVAVDLTVSTPPNSNR